MSSFFVNLWCDVKNENGERLSKMECSVSHNDWAIDNSSIQSLEFLTQELAESFALNVNISSKWM